MGCTEFQGVTRGYKRLQGGYRALKRVTDQRGLQEVTRG